MFMILFKCVIDLFVTFRAMLSGLSLRFFCCVVCVPFFNVCECVSFVLYCVSSSGVFLFVRVIMIVCLVSTAFVGLFVMYCVMLYVLLLCCFSLCLCANRLNTVFAGFVCDLLCDVRLVIRVIGFVCLCVFGVQCVCVFCL